MKTCLGFSCLVLLFFFPLSALANQSPAADSAALIANAEAGDPEAQYQLGSAYDTGVGVRRSGQNAMKYYLMAAEQGHAEAQNSVGSAFQAKRRYKEALRWYERAAEQDHALAINNLAYLYDLGLGVEQDKHKGLELYLRSADLGWAEAMWNIANMYGAGELGEIDLPAACIWTVRARTYAAADHSELQEYLANAVTYLESTLSGDELDLCNKEARSWAPSSENGEEE